MSDRDSLLDSSMEVFRRKSFLDSSFFELAKWGFYNTGTIVKCFSCNYEFNANNNNKYDSNNDFSKLHKSDCVFVKNLRVVRSKKFDSNDSLKFEKQRLDTFIEWPIPWLSPDDLAADGFYYLRKNDHCACIFCNVIIGAWAENDITPRAEHARYSPQCPFINNHQVGNITSRHGAILEKVALDGEEYPLQLRRECDTNTYATHPPNPKSKYFGKISRKIQK